MSEPISIALSSRLTSSVCNDDPVRAFFAAGGIGVLLFLNDLVVILLAVIMPETFAWDDTNTLPQWLLDRSLVASVVIFLFHWLRHYQIRQPVRREVSQVILIALMGMVMQAGLRWMTRSVTPDIFLLEFWTSAVVLLLAGRRMLRKLLERQGLRQQSVVVIGATVPATIELLKHHLSADYEVVGSLDPQTLMNLSEQEYCHELRRHGGAEGALVVLDAASRPLIEPLLRQDLLVGAVSWESGTVWPRLRAVFRLSHQATLLMPIHRLTDPLSRGGKRLIDILVVTAAMVLSLTVLAPVLIGVVLAIKADGGPLLFRQSRVGRHGRAFECLKLRTMRVNAEEMLHREVLCDPEKARKWHQEAKLRDDPRVTPIGRFLRRTSLDELPQIINVLRGEMSLVGPRPVVPAEIPRYGQDAAYYLRVCPGLTGLWQVSGRNNLDYPTRVRLDASYVGNWTLSQDIAILFRTLPALITGRGAC
ncbi:putative UDP-galactose-lipid carrier transferase [Gammaproteobacteria bacterium]